MNLGGIGPSGDDYEEDEDAIDWLSDEEGEDAYLESSLAEVESSNPYWQESGYYDWSWASQPIRDQGGCGSCWAVAGNTVFSARNYMTNEYT